jgi:hypothetical protein
VLQKPARRYVKSHLIQSSLSRAISSLAPSSSIGGKELEKTKNTLQCLRSNGSRGSRFRCVERGILYLLCLVGIRKMGKSHTSLPSMSVGLTQREHCGPDTV